MHNPTKRVPPIKLLGARRNLLSLVWGALVGVGAAVLSVAWFLPVVKDPGLRAGLAFVASIFWLLLGPPLTLVAASLLAVSGFTHADFAVVGRWNLALVGLAGAVAGIIVGSSFGSRLTRLVHGSDAVLIFVTQLVGIGGALLPLKFVGRGARRRLEQSQRQSCAQAES